MIALAHLANKYKSTTFASERCLLQNGYTRWFEFALKMDDSSVACSTLGLQKDSEFLEIFNHFLLKQLENGIGNRLFLSHHNELYVKEQFGLTDVQPLATKNVMFLLIWAVAGFFTSLTITLIEIIIKKINIRNLRMEQSGNEESKGRRATVRQPRLATIES